MGITSLVSTFAIVPVTVISCGPNATNSVDEAIVKLNAAALTQLNTTNINTYAISNEQITIEAAVGLLPSNSSNLDSLSKYFNTSLITNVATNNGVNATYSASTQTIYSNNLVIIVTMTLGLATATQIINISGWPSIPSTIN